jgi:hypothetical protein
MAKSKAQVRLRRRKAKADVGINKAKRTIKTLSRQLRKAESTLAKRVRARRKM